MTSLERQNGEFGKKIFLEKPTQKKKRNAWKELGEMSEKEAKREYLGELEKISRNVKEEQSLELVNILNGSSPSINKKSHRKEETREEDSIAITCSLV